jgi:hypothetical protein
LLNKTVSADVNSFQFPFGKQQNNGTGKVGNFSSSFTQSSSVLPLAKLHAMAKLANKVLIASLGNINSVVKDMRGPAFSEADKLNVINISLFQRRN